MSLVFSVPGKTFLAGEYLVLQGGPALVFLSEPRFELKVKKGSGDIAGIHPDSPAGVFIQAHREEFASWNLEFSEAYQGRGGFGASTAQFLGVYAAWLYKEAPQQDMEKILDFKHLLEEYYRVAWNGQGQRPSGADLIGQLKGAMTFVDKARGMISVHGFPFQNLEFALIHTGNKVATHEHLRSLQNFDAGLLLKAFHKINDSFGSAKEELFIEGIESYAQALNYLGFTCEPTLKLLDEVRSMDGVLAAKGCGALGADVICVVTLRGQGKALMAFCQDRGLHVMATSSDISSGLQIRGTL